jgi:hypothetical protein
MQEEHMRAALLVIALCFVTSACNKSSPPPTNPVKPRTIVVGG